MKVAVFVAKHQAACLTTRGPSPHDTLVDPGASGDVSRDTDGMTELRPAEEGEHVMMNAEPAPITMVGTKTYRLRCTRTGKLKEIVRKNVSVVPRSHYHIMSWSGLADDLKTQTGREHELTMGRRSVVVPTVDGPIHGVRCGGLFFLRHYDTVVAAVNAVRAEEKEEAQADTQDLRRFLTRMEQGGVAEASPAAVDPAGNEVSKGELVLALALRVARVLHLQMAHASLADLQFQVRDGSIIVKSAAVRAALLAFTPADLGCEACIEAAIKKSHTSEQKEEEKEYNVPGLWTVDHSGPFPPSAQGNRWFSVWVAPNHKGVFVVFSKTKAEALLTLRSNRLIWERETGEKMLELKADRGREIRNHAMLVYCGKHGIKLSFTPPDSSKGPAESYIGVLQDKGLAQIKHARLSGVGQWDESIAYAASVRDMMPCRALDGISMFEHRTGRKPPLHELGVWGALAFAHVPKQLRPKFAARGRRARFLGFARDGEAYRLRDLRTNMLFHARKGSVKIFNEHMPGVSSPPTGMASSRESVFRWDSEPPARLPVSAPGLRLSNRFGVLAGAVDAEREEGEHGVDEKQETEPVEKRLPPRQRAPAPDRLDISNNAAWHRAAPRPKTSNATIVTPTETAEEAYVRRAQMFVRQLPRATVQQAWDNARAGWWQWQPRSAPPPNRPVGWKPKPAPQRKAAKREEHRRVLPAFAVPQRDSEIEGAVDEPYWRAARKEELMTHAQARTMLEMTPEQAYQRARAEHKRIVDSRWAYDVQLQDENCTKEGPTYRRNEQGRLVRYKARLVAKGFMQEEGRDYTHGHTYAPTPTTSSVRLIMALSLGRRFDMHQLDIKGAFLIPELPPEEAMLMRLPRSRFDAERIVLLLKCIYGLRQSAHHWNREVDTVLRADGFVALVSDRCVYVHRGHDGKIDCILAIHVDDVLVSAKPDIMEKVKNHLKKRYTMKDDGEARWFLAVKVRRDKERGIMELSQTAYIEDILRGTGMLHCNPWSTPARPNEVLTKSNQPATELEKAEMLTKPYRETVGKLVYLAGATRPDISYAVGQCSRFVADPRPQHWQAVEHILHYLAGTKTYGLQFNIKGENRIVGYSDSDHASDLDLRRSTSGFVFMLFGAAISWKSKKQDSVGRSTAEAELIALDFATREALWLRNVCLGLDVPGAQTIPIHEDNEACLNIANGAKWSPLTKHLDIKYFAVRENIIRNEVAVLPISTNDNLADAFTKALAATKFNTFRTLMGVRVCTLV